MINFNQIIVKLGANVQEFTFQFKSHPNYPSALAFSDTLNFLGVKIDAYNLDKEYWHELPEEFITIYKDKFSLVKKEENVYRIYSNDEQTISENELLVNSQDLVMLFEQKVARSPNGIPQKYKIFILMVGGLYLGCNFLLRNWVSFTFNAVSLLGIYISFEIFSEKFGKTSGTLNSICGHTAKSTDSSCSKIINSDVVEIFGLKLSDLSLIYFVAIAILGLLLPFTSLLLQITSLISILVILYSLYIQIFVEKSSCKICLLIILLLIFQIILSRFFINVPISFFIISASLLIFSSIFIGTIYINDLSNKNDSLGKANVKNLKFKRNYDIFIRELTLQNKVSFKNNKDGFFLGNPDAKLHISIISNPHCGFCKDAHLLLEKLLANYPDDISAQIRFNYYPENESEISKILMQTFSSIYSNFSKEEFLNALHFWFEQRNEELFFKNYKNLETPNMEEIISSSLENKKNGLNFTPNIMLNGFLFPDKYDREDIFYFIDELLEDDEILK